MFYVKCKIFLFTYLSKLQKYMFRVSINISPLESVKYYICNEKLFPFNKTCFNQNVITEIQMDKFKILFSILLR